MSAPNQNAQNPTIPAIQTANAATISSQGSSSTVAAGSAPPVARSSYASATKKASTPPAPPVVGAGSQNTQHGKSGSISVNGKPPIQPAVPTMTTPAGSSSNINGAPATGEHSRKPTMVYDGSGASTANGQAGGSNSRAPVGLKFGSMSGGSPAPTHSVPHHQNASLNAQPSNPRVTSPATSPSPIPAPASSGGRPPTNLSSQPNIVFGNSSEGGESNTRPVSLPPQPNNLPQAQHLRRESSQSGHGDMGHSMNMNRNFTPGGGRGRGYNHNQSFNPQMGHNSPRPPYQQMHAATTPRTGHAQHIPPPFQPGRPVQPNSPSLYNRSPQIPPATMHQPPQYPGQQAVFQGQFANPPYNTIYNLPPDHSYYNYGYAMHQQMYVPSQVVSGSAGRGSQFQMPMQPPYMQAPYGQPQATGMSRTNSQLSERPSSTIPQPQTPSMLHQLPVAHTPGAASASPAPSSSTFTIPPKKTNKAIVIKNEDGEVLNFDKKTASPAPPVQPRSPAIASTPTPPPRAPSAADSAHARTDSSAKTAEEKRQEFMDTLQKKIKKDKEKEDAEKKAAAEREAQAKSEAEAKAAKEKEEAEAKAAKEKEEAEAEAKAAKEKEEAESAQKAKEEEERLRLEEEERLIAEMEAAEREEEERERKYQEKKKKEAEEKAKREAEAVKKEEEEMKRLEREAEEREAARANETEEEKAKKAELFRSLKKNTQFGPATTEEATVTAPAPAPEPASEPASSAPPQAVPSRVPNSGKPKPSALKLDTNKPVEPAQPTAGMQALKSARFLQVQAELNVYPEGIKSPNPALNQAAKSKGRRYDKEFLLQFQNVFKEKPSIDWDSKLKETVGDGNDSARPQSARTPMGMAGRTPSRTGGLPTGGPAGGIMGNFINSRTLPPGTTSDQRFNASNTGARPPMINPLAQFGARPPSFMGAPGQLNRTTSFPSVAPQGGPNSPRNASSRGKGSRRGDNKGRRDEEQQAKQMPLTAGQDLKPLERSQSGWKPLSIVAPPTVVQSAGHMSPELVQRKVKAALNKMTPEKFDRIADQILEIAAQSKDETDGRTLRQVIQLTFEKACDEAHWASMYAKFCHRMLNTMSTEIKDDNVVDKQGNPVVGGALFRKYLLNRCQEEFERGWEANLPPKPEGETQEAALLSDEYYTAAAAKRKGLGLIQFIGELYKLGMLTLRIMHECVLKLLDFEGMPDESSIESLVKLLRTVGATMESTESGPRMIAMYFERIEKVMKMEGLPSRLYFMLLDTVDLRTKGWKSKDDAKGPKTIAEIHQEAAAAQQAAEMERNRSNQRGGPRLPAGRGDARSFSGGGMMPPPDYPRDRVGIDDLKKLGRGASGRNLSNNPGQLGPSPLFGSRSNSGRKGLGPNIMRGEESGASSRTATPPQKEKESGTHHVNSFSALMSLDASGEGAHEVGSPPSTTSSPPVTKSVPAAAKTSPDGEGDKPSDS